MSKDEFALVLATNLSSMPIPLFLSILLRPPLPTHPLKNPICFFSFPQFPFSLLRSLIQVLSIDICLFKQNVSFPSFLSSIFRI